MSGGEGKRGSRVGLVVGVFVLASVLPLAGEDWPEWRGRGRTGVWHETGVLDAFPPQGLDYKWRVPIGNGYGGPAVAGGRVFVTDFERHAGGGGGTERVLALDEETGEVLWTHSWEAPNRGLMPTYANGPRATPTVDEDRVYVLGSTGKLFCLRVADGKVLWRRDYVEDFGAEVPVWGMSGAPLVDGERLIALVGGEPDAKVVALDKGTGKELWRSLAADSEPGYAPPVLVEVGTTRQLIVWHPSAISSLDPATGRVYWEEPYEVAMGQTIATPILGGNRLLVSSSSHGSTLLALDGKKPLARVQWKGQSSSKQDVDGLHAFLATPFMDGDYIYGVGGLGYLRCIDARTGREVWKTLAATEEARIATAFLVKNGDRYFLNNDRGELILARLSPQGYAEISRTQLVEPLNRNTRVRRERKAVNWSHPAYANGHIFHRNDREIVRASLEK